MSHAMAPAAPAVEAERVENSAPDTTAHLKPDGCGPVVPADGTASNLNGSTSEPKGAADRGMATFADHARPRLTSRQAEVLAIMDCHVSEHGFPPTLRELGSALNIRSTNGVNDHLRALERKGYISREDWRARGMRVLHHGEVVRKPEGDSRGHVAREVLDAIIRHIDEWGYPPTREELAVLIQVQPHTVESALERLEREGCIRRRTGGARCVSVLTTFYGQPLKVQVVRCSP